MVDWVMRVESVSFRHAVEMLQNVYQPVAAVAPGVPPAKHSTVKKLPMPIERDAQDAHLLVQVIEYYRAGGYHYRRATGDRLLFVANRKVLG